MNHRLQALLITCFLSVLPTAPVRSAPTQSAEAEPRAARQLQLLRILRQDCGSCHGMQLKGGLGPALTAEALRELPHEAVAATIFHGRPGTPMPPWKSMISAAEADWLARQLQHVTPAASGTEAQK
ncbi:c-type cytochrome [Paucibacter sp. B51]|uniref:c-type cytochrome n=1 Tax=Paucibacter sp. B51 TaxID=2993315 RepID=UPI0022EBCD92|nr:cytochrome c [Paucibacter sp. B51]